jgi:hypothetical protein
MALEHTHIESQGPRRTADEDSAGQTSRWQEVFWLALILAAGLLPRLIFITSFPSRPISDFLYILNFAIYFRDDWLAKIVSQYQWRFFSPGLPFILSLIFRFVHGSPELIGRWATAISTGLVPVLPYILWKNVFRLRTRIFAALLLAFWPGQILFSSVLAQDNWILFSAVAISILAVGILTVKKINGSPVLAALLYAVTVAIRQEMLIALLPVAILAIMGGKTEKYIRNLLIGGGIVAMAFIALTIQRGMATGRYTLTTEHFGVSILGAYVPGAGMGWISPIPYIEGIHPELFDQNGYWGNELENEALNLARQEFLRRPIFHVIRSFGSTLTNIFEMDTQITWWSLGIIHGWSVSDETVLPYQYRKDALMLSNYLAPLLRFYPMFINTLFACSLFFALGQRRLLRWISPILVTIALKTGLHAVIVSQPRYFLVVIALEMLVIAIVWDRMLKKEHWKLSLGSILAGIVTIFLLITAMNSAREYVAKHDLVSQSDYKTSSCLVSSPMPSEMIQRRPS